MKRKISSIVIFIFCLFVGFVVATQSGMMQRLGGGLISVNKIKPYEEKLASTRAEKESAMQRLSKDESELESLEKEQSGNDAYLKSVVSDIEKYKMSAGFYEVEGPGLVITVKDLILLRDIM